MKTTMLFLIFLCLTAFASFSQPSQVKMELSYQYILKKPYKDLETYSIVPDSCIEKYLRRETDIAIISIIRPKYYKILTSLGDTGYVFIEHVRFYNESGLSMKYTDVGLSGFEDYNIELAKRRFRELPQRRTSDSLIIVQEKYIDSLRLSKIAANILKNGFGILSYNFKTGYGLVDFSISVVNYHRNTIKYVWFTVYAYNSVDDVIEKKIVKLIGPIEYKENGSADFENVFYTNVFSYGVIKKIKIQFMNGTLKEINPPVINTIVFR